MTAKSVMAGSACLRYAAGALLVVVGLGSFSARAQDTPPESVPPDAERVRVDLTFVVQDLAFVVENLYSVTETEREVLIELSADVLFDFDKANLRPLAVTSLQQAASRIRESARGDVRVEGHTDSRGSNEYNQTLSEQRADAVRDWLVSEGSLTNIKFATNGFGESRPKIPNEKNNGEDDPLGRQQNRRVEIIITTVG